MRQIRSTVTEDGVLELELVDVELREPRDHEVVVEIEAAPINPSDLGPMFGPADMSSARESGSGVGRKISADIPDSMMRMVEGRVGSPLPMGNEGAGTVVAAGSSSEAQALLGKTVAAIGGAMYAERKVVGAQECLVLPDDVSAAEGASCFVNPLTTLGMLETMRLEGHTALVHTAAASNLGQMLVKLCQEDDVPLVCIVRRDEHVELLRDLGASHVCNSSDDDFMEKLVEAVADTDATLGFDATGGGTLASDILTAMEAAQSRSGETVGRYGSSRHKQVYLYGGLDRSPTTLSRNYGMAWGIGGWVLPNFLGRIGGEEAQRLQERVASEITTTFASSYSAVISLDEVVSLDAVKVYGQQATGQKYLVAPQQGR